LQIATKAADRSDAASLLQLFCSASRQFFKVSGVYFWRRYAGDELVGEQANGKLADRFIGLRLLPQQSAVTVEAVRRRKTTFINRFQPNATFPAAYQFDARSLMAAPLVVFDEVIGAVTFLHDTDEVFFNDDLATKATILAGQLGSLLEATRQGEASREERRRSQLLAEVAQTLHGIPDVAAVLESLADRTRDLLHTRLVSILLRREGPFELRAVSAESPQLALSFRTAHDRQTIRFAADLAQRAVSAGEPISINISNDQPSVGGIISSGVLIAAPFRTAQAQGAILIYPREQKPFTADEKTLVAALAGFGAVAVAHAELSATAEGHARELHQLLEISNELTSTRDLDRSLRAFVVRAADFLGFGRCFVALEENGKFHVRYGADEGQAQPVDSIFPEGIVTRAVRRGEVFWTDDLSQVPDNNPQVITQYRIRQLLTVPLAGAGASLLGMFGVLDRLDGTGISQEDIRRARALAAHVSVVLEVAHSLHQSERNQRSAEALAKLAREIDGVLRLPDLSLKFMACAVELSGAPKGAFALFQDSKPESVVLWPPAAQNSRPFQTPDGDAEQVAFDSTAQTDAGGLRRQLVQELSGLFRESKETIVSGRAAEILTPQLASALGWEDCVLVRIGRDRSDTEAVLCLSGLNHPLTEQDRKLLRGIAGHAAMVIENARLFTRMERANRHWMEIFDAITDYIVVHDEKDNVLRVNRSLAAMIGVAPGELIGVNMRALLALTNERKLFSCPFCRSTAEDSDEFVHPALDRTYLVSTSRVHGASEESLQTIHVLKDITDRREAERRYRELFDNIQEGLFFSTPEGRFVEVNDALVSMLGYSGREELLQADIPAKIYFSPEQRQIHAVAVEQDGHLHNFEATLRRKNGSPIYVLINAFGTYDSSGKLVQIRGLMLDVTGIRTYQTELQRERDFSGKILSNTQSFILVSDIAGLISYANRRWYEAGFDQSELIGRPLLDFAASADAPKLSEALEATLRGNQVDNLELHIVHGRETAGQFSVNLSPMRDEQNNINSIVVVMTDITDAAELRDKLLHTEKMAAVGQLVSGVAHEVNNPLTAILGFADLLLENPALPDTARKDIRVILQEAQRTKQIVQNLLSFARQMPPQRNPVQINIILRRTIQLRAYDFASHGVDVVEHLDEGLPDIIGDAHQLQQVFLNILNNAYDAVHEIGRPARIEIVTTKSGDSVEISFCDNGPGISNPDRVFDPFFTTKEVGKGTGLGLSICYGIVKEHGGEILCHNNPNGVGATFIVRFPATPTGASLGVAAGVNPI